MSEGILSAIGNTPLIGLTRAISGARFRVFAKLEGLNPGGSTKDRPAFGIIEHAIKTGEIEPGAVVVESSSGNMGIGLAQACSYFGLRFICVVDPKTTLQNIHILKAFGAEVDMVTKPNAITGEYLHARLDRVQELLSFFKRSFWPNQYSNPHNALAHHQTMSEIEAAMGGKVDYLFCATSTCGTIRGCSEYVRTRNLKTKIIAVDAVGSVIFGGCKGPRLIPGHGASVRPALHEPGLVDDCIKMTDLDCVVGCRRLAVREAILVGGSSGAVIMGLDSMKRKIPPGSSCVVMFHDRGERYLDTIFSDAWVEEQFGDVSHLWSKVVEEH